MAQNAIDKILESRRQTAAPPPDLKTEEDKFYSILVGDVVQEHFLELQFRAGPRTCFSYTDLMWFNYDPEGGFLDMEFGGYLVTLKGRGLGGTLFTGIKQKRVSWVKEADSEMQDHDRNALFIESITIVPPKE
jgi:hypothetical protein